MVTYRLALASLSASGLGTEIVSDVLAVGFPHKADQVVRWSRMLNGAGSIEFTLDMEAITPDVYAPGKRELHLYRDDGGGEVLVWGGRLWVADVDHDWVRFMGLGWYETLRHREMAVDFYKVDTEQLDIAWDLINYTQTQTGGGLGITQQVVADSGITRTVLYCAEERQNIAQAIEDLATADNGFDFDISPGKEWQVSHPVKGEDLSATVSLNTATTVQDLTYTIDATVVANEVAGIGDRKECEPIHYATVANIGSRDEYGLLQSTVSRSDIKEDGPLINALARKYLKLHKAARKAPVVKYPLSLDPNQAGPSPVTGEFSLGDVIKLQASKGYATFADPFRVMAYTVVASQNGEERIELNLDASDEDVPEG